MSLAVCLLFEARSDRVVRGVWQRLEDKGIATLHRHTHGRHAPHLSLAVLRQWRLPDVHEAMDSLPGAEPLDVAVQGTVVFPRGRTAFACASSVDLATRQDRVVSALIGAGADLHRHYEPGRWVPHVSLGTSASADQLPVVVSAVSDVLPLHLRATRAALVDTSTGRQWPLARLP